MLSISRFTAEHRSSGCVTDSARPVFSFALESDHPEKALKQARIQVNGSSFAADRQIEIPYEGPALKPFTEYTARVCAEQEDGARAEAELTFETGRMGSPWTAKWITDGSYVFKEKKISPVPMQFRKTIQVNKAVKRARIYSTAMGIYELMLDGDKIGKDYFAPGFTSYSHQLQYQCYDVTKQLNGTHCLEAVVAGGWAVGSFVFTRQNRVSADRQALLLELRIDYADGSQEVLGTDESWEVSEDGPFRMADIYDGETYDATVEERGMTWRKAAVETLRVHPELIATYGDLCTAHEVLHPVSVDKRPDGTLIYDFGQNFAGVVDLTIQGKAGERITVRHAEILNPDGTLNTAFLRTAKATAAYVCREGEQHYSPRLTYMGFRYISVEGIEEERITVAARAIYSDVEQIGSFRCSDAMLNQLQSNIVWGAKSNFVDIPTDCPQRDERMGWTGDIAVFAPTACFNFEMSRFLEKWLRDVRSEQLKTGGIPNTVPVQGYGFPATMPTMAIDFWGDASVLVPWALYQAGGNVAVLKENYGMMKKYVNACRFWAGFGFGKNRYIWNTPSVLHFGDWVAPDVPQMSQWQKRSKWTATASLCHTSGILAQVAEIIGEKEDAVFYRSYSKKVADAYCSVLTDGNGKLLEEFQTAYVLPLQFDMFPGAEEKKKAVDNLVRLIEKNDYCIGTGFPGTPFILFALADHGRADVAYQMLMNTKCPSWLYEVRVGATTIWERWDGLDENGVCPIGDDGTDTMISYNHYASGAVGAFLYQRTAGIEAVEPGYRTYKVRPIPGGGLTWAEGEIRTPYGVASSKWKIEENQFRLSVKVPMGTRCEVCMPDGTTQVCSGGEYSFSCKYE